MAQTAYALTSYETVVLLAGLPLGLLALIALLVAVPGWARRGRYRPGMSWAAQPVWFNGPAADPDTAASAGVPGPSGAPGPVGGARATW